MAFIYILHFDEKLSHAQHYAGCTESLRNRLTRHANGAGSHLTRALCQAGIGWKLGGLFETNHTQMRRLERSLKDQANAARYCQLCTKPTHAIIGAKEWSLSLVPFAATSASLSNGCSTPPSATVRFTTEHEATGTMTKIKKLMRADKDALGFIPAGGSQGLQQLIPQGKIAIAEMAGEVIGYAAFTLSPDKEQLNIHQCCVQDDARLMGIGRELVNTTMEQYPDARTVAKVRNDLAANHFWEAIGFTQVAQRRHATSGSLINHYCHTDEE